MEKNEYYLSKIQRFNWDKDLTHQSEMNALIEAEEMNLVKLLNPRIFIDGGKWCVLHGGNIQNGVCGFGDTPRKAIIDFNKSFDRPIEYCMPDEVNTREEHEQYLKDIGATKK